MQLSQLQQNGQLMRPSALRHTSSGKHTPLNSYATHSYHIGSSNRSPSHHYGLTQRPINQAVINKDTVSRSVYLKSQGGQMQGILRDVKQKIAVMGKVLLEHQLKIGELEGKNKENEKELSNIVNKGSFLEQPGKSFKDRIILQIEKLREQINKSSKSSTQLLKPSKSIPKLQQALHTVESQLLDKVKQLKQKTYNQLKLMNESFRKELEYQIHNTQDINKTVFNRIQKDMIELQKKIGSKMEDSNTKQRSGKQRYLGVLQMIKFKEIVQRHVNKGDEKQGDRQQVVINEGTYFLDKDGYLLDKEGYYITGDDDKWIQLSTKQIKILKAYNILQQ